jgi:uncharacterized membrane protein YvlD (DUF360 family)
MKLLLRWVIVAFSLFVAAWLVPGIRVEGNAWLIYAVMAVILGFANAVVLIVSIVSIILSAFIKEPDKIPKG